MHFAELQSHIYNLPEGQDFGFEHRHPNSEWSQNSFKKYEECIQDYNNTEKVEARVVRYSRYLVRDRPLVVIEVLKWKDY